MLEWICALGVGQRLAGFIIMVVIQMKLTGTKEIGPVLLMKVGQVFEIADHSVEPVVEDDVELRCHSSGSQVEAKRNRGRVST